MPTQREPETAQHESGFFPGHGRRQPRIFWQHWRPRQLAMAPVVLVHGLSEHSGNYEHVAAYLVDRGVPVWALDHRGHGRSGGPRVFVEDFDHYLADLGTLVERVTAAAGESPALVGHSMGGLIAIAYALQRPATLRALVACSPWLATRLHVPLPLRLLTPVLAAVTPRLQLHKAGGYDAGDYAILSRDPAVQARHASDPLRCRVTTPRWFHECIKAQRRVSRSAAELRLPLLFLVAGSDPMVEPQAAADFFHRVSSQDKTYVEYPDRVHELFNDIGYEEVLATLYRWLEPRLAPTSASDPAPAQ